MSIIDEIGVTMCLLKRWFLYRAADFMSIMCLAIFASIESSDWEIESFFTIVFGGLWVWQIFMLYLPLTILMYVFYLRDLEFIYRRNYDLWFFVIHLSVAIMVIFLINALPTIIIYLGVAPFVFIFYSLLLVYLKQKHNKSVLMKNHSVEE